MLIKVPDDGGDSRVENICIRCHGTSLLREEEDGEEEAEEEEKKEEEEEKEGGGAAILLPSPGLGNTQALLG